MAEPRWNNEAFLGIEQETSKGTAVPPQSWTVGEQTWTVAKLAAAIVDEYLGHPQETTQGGDLPDDDEPEPVMLTVEETATHGTGRPPRRTS